MAWSDVWPIMLIALAFLALASIPLLRTLSRRRGRGTSAGPVPLPPEEAELVEGPVWACMRCGSTAVGMGGVSQGLLPGAGAHFTYACRRCGHRGPALEFESVTAYRQFVKGLRADEDAASGEKRND